MLSKKQSSKKLKLICRDFISNNHYKGLSTFKRNNGKSGVRVYLTKKTLDFIKSFGLYVHKEKIKQDWKTPGKEKLIIVDATFFFPRTDMDANNYWKVLLDILTKQKVWNDDNVVMERVNRIYYNSSDPRIELTIYPSDNIGVFDSREEARNFLIDNCFSCKNFSSPEKPCEIFKNLLENKLHKSFDLNSKKCSKSF